MISFSRINSWKWTEQKQKCNRYQHWEKVPTSVSTAPQMILSLLRKRGLKATLQGIIWVWLTIYAIVNFVNLIYRRDIWLNKNSNSTFTTEIEKLSNDVNRLWNTLRQQVWELLKSRKKATHITEEDQLIEQVNRRKST